MLPGALIIIIGALLLAKNLQNETPDESPTENMQSTINGLLIPHHLLAQKNIEKIYAATTDKNIETVIVISPNHFNFGYNYIQTTDQNFEDQDGNRLEIDQNLLKKIAGKNKTDPHPAKIENKNFKKEHGISVHVPFITKSFPNAKILPIILKRNTSEIQLNKLSAALIGSIINQNTVIIASIDFSHYAAEEIASKSDEKIIEYLQDWSDKTVSSTLEELNQLTTTDTTTNKEAVAMDSPESLYIFLKFLESKNSRNFSLFARTSTQTLTGINDPNLNTSHIFGEFK